MLIMKKTLIILGSWLLALSAPAADIVALCIGNNAYTRVEDSLDTPINDATLMKRTLEALPGGADVKILTDATKEDIEIALNALKVRAQGAKLALVFYSGHGTEDQPDGFAQNETFLLPVDATIPDVNYLPTRAVSLSTVLTALKAAPVTARAVILDCCRSGAPRALAALASTTKSFGDLDERVKTALGKAVVPDATLIAFAASPGRKAAAFLTEADENSPFTTFLTQQFATGAGNLRDLVEAAAEETETRTGKRQVPYVSYNGAASAIRQITFRSSAAGPATGGMTEAEIERRARELAASMAAGSGGGPGGSGMIDAPRAGAQTAAGRTPLLATKDAPFVNALGMEFVPVVSYKNGKKVLFSIWETRRQDYAAYAAKNSGVDGEWKAQEYTGVPIGQADKEPVVSVSWEDATAFNAWLTETERAAGRIGASDEYRLPTDVEWSYAVGIGEQEDASATPEAKDAKIADVYPWGTGFPPPANSGNYADSSSAAKFGSGFTVIEGYRDGHSTTAPVGSYEANSKGLYDLGGNVYEWCGDWYNAEQKYRVLRGASWFNGNATVTLSSIRGSLTPGNRCDLSGFRCVLVVGGGG